MLRRMVFKLLSMIATCCCQSKKASDDLMQVMTIIPALWVLYTSHEFVYMIILGEIVDASIKMFFGSWDSLCGCS